MFQDRAYELQQAAIDHGSWIGLKVAIVRTTPIDTDAKDKGYSWLDYRSDKTYALPLKAQTAAAFWDAEEPSGDGAGGPMVELRVWSTGDVALNDITNMVRHWICQVEEAQPGFPIVPAAAMANRRVLDASLILETVDVRGNSEHKLLGACLQRCAAMQMCQSTSLNVASGVCHLQALAYAQVAAGGIDKSVTGFVWRDM